MREVKSKFLKRLHPFGRRTAENVPENARDTSCVKRSIEEVLCNVKISPSDEVIVYLIISYKNLYPPPELFRKFA